MVYYYSVIKCTPCIKRCETVNIGIVVFCQGELKIRLAITTSKFLALENDFIRDELSDLRERWNFFTRALSSPEEKHAAITSPKRIGIWCGGLGFLTVENTDELDRKIQDLMSKLVI